MLPVGTIRPMRTVRSAFAVSLLFLKPTLRQPIFMLLVSTLPLSFVLIFRIIGGAAMSYHALYGILVVFAFNAGVVSLPQQTVMYRTLRLQEMYSASPVGPGIYACGLGLSRLLFASIPLSGVIALLVAREQMRPVAVPLVVIVLLMSSFIGIMIGFLLSVLVTNIYMISSVANLAGLILTVVPPVYYPLQLVDPKWRWLPLVLPTTNAAGLVRDLGGIADAGPGLMMLHLVLLILWVTVLGGVVFHRARWRLR